MQFHWVAAKRGINVLGEIYGQTAMARTLKEPVNTVRSRGVFELSKVNYVQTWMKRQQKGLETSMVFEPLQFERSKFHCTCYNCAAKPFLTLSVVYFKRSQITASFIPFVLGEWTSKLATPYLVQQLLPLIRALH